MEETLGRTTRQGENLREYFYEKLTLLSRCEITGTKAVDCVIHSITDIVVRNGAQALRCIVPEELLLIWCPKGQKVSYFRHPYN